MRSSAYDCGVASCHPCIPDSFACLPKCPGGAGQKEVSCAGSRACAGRGRCPGGGQPLPPSNGCPPLRRHMITRTGAGRCRLMHGGYGHGAGTSAGRQRVFSSIQSDMSLGPKRFGPSDMHLGLARPPRIVQPPREPTHLLGHAVRVDFALRRRRRATESNASLALPCCCN